MWSLRLLVLLAAIDVLAAKRTLKVLVTAPSMGYSHMAFQGRLADLLVDADHEVVSKFNVKMAELSVSWMSYGVRGVGRST